MREERKLNKAMRQDGIEDQSGILEELKRRYPQYVEQSDVKKAPARKRRVAVFSALAAVAVCAAIIVPCAVLLPNRHNGGSDNIRYCTQNDYSITEGVEYTIGKYRKNNNLNFLYFDWYEACEERITICYTSNANNEVLCLKEQVYLPQSDEFVQFSLTKSNVFLDVFDLTIEHCQSEYAVDNHTVKWGIKGDDALCLFEDSGYRYFIQIFNGQDENRLFEFVAELLEKN